MKRYSAIPLVSVIIPVYKVEKYLERCIDSVIGQTYENIEVILIDDGSPDRCGDICEQYARSDERVRVIHRLNGGLSAARNTGIDASVGDYLFFVDSDDYISKDAIEYLMRIIDKDQSDIAIGSFRLSREENVYRTKEFKISENDVVVMKMDPVQVLIDSLYEKKSTFHAWGKLYSSSVFENIRYPEGCLYEDIGTTYKLYLESDKISVSTEIIYHYTIRNGSITHSSFQPRMMDAIIFATRISEIINDSKYTAAKPASNAYLYMSTIYMFETLVFTKNTKIFHEQFLKCASIIKQLRWGVVQDVAAPMRTRLYAAASLMGCRTLVFLLNIKNSIKNKGKGN